MRSLSNVFSLLGEAFILQIVAVGLLFCVHFVAARVGGPEAYGVFSYALTVASFLSVVTSLGLANTNLRFVAGYRDTQEWALLRGLIRRSSQLILVISAVVGSIMTLTAFAVWTTPYAVPLLGAGILLPILSLGFWRSAANRGLQHVRHSLLPEEIVRPLIFLACCYLISLAALDGSSELLIGAYFVAAFFSLLIGLKWLSSDIPRECLRASPAYATAIWLKASFPVLVAGICQELMTRADLLILGAFSTMEATGLYNAASRLSFLNVFPLRVVDSVIPPKIAAAYHAGRHDEVQTLIRKGMLLSACGSLPLFAIMMIFPGQVLAIFGESFVDASSYLRILAVGQFVNALTGPVGYALLMTGHEKYYRNTIATVTIISVAVNLLIIPRFGAIGAAYVMCGSTIALNLALLVGVKKRILKAS